MDKNLENCKKRNFDLNVKGPHLSNRKMVPKIYLKLMKIANCSGFKSC